MKLASSIAIGALALAASAKEAWALGPLSVEVGAKAGVGTNPSDSGPNPLGFGIGARGGIEIMNIYAGVNVMYYLGASESVTTPVGNVDASTHTLMYGLEGGYGFKFADDIFTLRPQLGLGNASFSTSSGGLSTSTSNIYLEPGVALIVGLGGLYVGGDANYLVIPGVDNGLGSSKTYSSFTLHGQIGLKF